MSNHISARPITLAIATLAAAAGLVISAGAAGAAVVASGTPTAHVTMITDNNPWP